MAIIYIPVEVPDADLAEMMVKSGALAGDAADQFTIGSIGNQSPAPRRTQPAQVSGEEVDPWASDADPTSGASAPTRTRSTTTSRPSDDEVKTVKTKFGVQTWRFPPDAPKCDCGEPAGLMSATSQKGNRYKAYKCAKGAGDDWRNKCEFSEFTR